VWRHVEFAENSVCWWLCDLGVGFLCFRAVCGECFFDYGYYGFVVVFLGRCHFEF